jgi:hypothetical protein
MYGLSTYVNIKSYCTTSQISSFNLNPLMSHQYLNPGQALVLNQNCLKITWEPACRFSAILGIRVAESLFRVRGNLKLINDTHASWSDCMDPKCGVSRTIHTPWGLGLFSWFSAYRPYGMWPHGTGRELHLFRDSVTDNTEHDWISWLHGQHSNIHEPHSVTISERWGTHSHSTQRTRRTGKSHSQKRLCPCLDC